AVYLLNSFMDKDDASSPGMPGIENLALVPNLGTVGVTAPSCITPFARTVAWAICRQPITPSSERSAPRHRNGTGRCAQSGATRPAPLPHRAEQAQMTNRLYSSLDEKPGSGHLEQMVVTETAGPRSARSLWAASVLALLRLLGRRSIIWGTFVFFQR